MYTLHVNEESEIKVQRTKQMLAENKQVGKQGM